MVAHLLAAIALPPREGPDMPRGKTRRLGKIRKDEINGYLLTCVSNIVVDHHDATALA
jgi:hypothetical protein